MTEPSLLSDAQLARFRTDWVPDLVEDRAEWGTAPVVASDVDAGDDAIALSGLGAGTLSAGTEIVVLQDGVFYSYFIKADVAIASGTATIQVQPRIRPPGLHASDKVGAKKRSRGAFATVRGVVYFTDAQLQDIARRATSRWQKWIAQQYNYQEGLFRAMRVIALQEMLADPIFCETIRANDATRGEAQIGRLEKQLAEDTARVQVQETGASTFWMVR